MNDYVSFITDEHFRMCVAHLYNSYVAAHQSIDKEKLYGNKLDVIKLTFDKAFEELNDEELINREINRQIDKTITNAIGTFHEEILGGIDGYVRGNLSGWDIKANNDTLFADIKNKHNTMNSSSTEALYQKLERLALQHPSSKCYWVQIIATDSFNVRWSAKFDKGTRQYDNPQVYKISGDKFYELLTNRPNALYELYCALPVVLNNFLQVHGQSLNTQTSALLEIRQDASRLQRTLLNQITYDNLKYYNGFDSL